MGQDIEQDQLTIARRQYSNCIFSNAWTLTILGLIPAVPLGVYYRTYAPLVMVSVLGSGADYINASQICKGLAEKIKALEVEQEAASKERNERVRSSTL